MAGVTGEMRVADSDSDPLRMLARPADRAVNGEVGGCATGSCNASCGGGEVIGDVSGDEPIPPLLVATGDSSTVFGWNGFGEERWSYNGGGMSEKESVADCVLNAADVATGDGGVDGRRTNGGGVCGKVIVAAKLCSGELCNCSADDIVISNVVGVVAGNDSGVSIRRGRLCCCSAGSAAARSFAAFLAADLAWSSARRVLAGSSVRPRTPATSIPV